MASIIRFLVFFFLVVSMPTILCAQQTLSRGFNKSQHKKSFYFDIGMGQSRITIQPRTQDYKDQTGTQVSFSPTITESILGSRSHIEAIFNIYGFEYGTSHYSYDVKIPANISTTGAVETADATLEMINYGINLHLRKKIGGIFIGVGQLNSKEKISATGKDYEQSSSQTYYQYGAELLFGVIAIQASFLVGHVGYHPTRTNSLELMLSF